jgi:hypothetical protein
MSTNNAADYVLTTGSTVWTNNAGQQFTVTPIVPPVVAGDYNRSGTVDAADYVLWRDTLGSTTNLEADGNMSGTIDSGDYNYWRARFGNSGSAAGNAIDLQAVPEPGVCTMLGGIALVAARVVWRRSRMVAFFSA